MRAPSWETSAGALAALLNSVTQAFMVDLFTFTLSGGAVLRYTSNDVPVTVNGIAYGTGPVITRGRTKLSVGISVDTLDVKIAADNSVTVSGVPILQFIARGGMDGARLVLSRAFAAAPTTIAWVGTLDLFPGRVGDTKTSRYESQLTINSDSELLDVMIPRNVYQPGCGNTLFDGTCGLAKSAFSATLTATSATDSSRTVFSATTGQAAGYYALGWAVCLTGANAGSSRTLKASATGSLTAIQPWPSAVAIGDTFKVYAGCDKQQTTCATKFANLARFRGHPYVPAPETVL